MSLLFSSLDLIPVNQDSLLTKFEDKIFISGILTSIDDSSVSIVINKTCPIFAINDFVADEFRMKAGFAIETLDCFFNDINSPFILISGGAIVNVIKNSKMAHILLKKDSLAPSDAGRLTEPAGRCGEHPYETIFKELNEELDIVLLDRSDKKLLVIGPDSESISSQQKYLFKIKDKNAVDNFDGGYIDSLEYFEIEPISSNLDRICYITIDDAINKVTTQIVGPHFYNESKKTLEVRQRFILDLNNDDLLYFDGDRFGREVKVFDEEELYNLPKTEYLEFYLNGEIE